MARSHPVHPVADAFPMMSEDDLRELGEDIKQHGLKSPILWGDAHDDASPKYVLDGRNRLAAMELVGLDPAELPVSIIASIVLPVLVNLILNLLKSELHLFGVLEPDTR